jgi:hypothetical protein
MIDGEQELQALDETFFAPASTDKISHLVAEYRGLRARIERVAALMQDEAVGVMGYFIDGNCDERRSAVPSQVDRLFAPAGAIAALNASYWNRALQLTDVLDLMPQARRTEWYEQIREHKTPDFEEETVRSTLMSLLNSRATFFAERVDGVFRSLSGSHVTNRPEGFSKRMIINGILDKFGYVEHDKAGYINDLRCVIGKFSGRDEPRWNSTSRVIEIARDRGEWIVLDGGALRLRVFKKGTAHLEVHSDMAWRLNQTLASLHPTAIPSALRTKPKSAPKSFATLTTALPFAVVNVLADVLKDHRGGTALKLPFSGLHDNKELRKQVVAVLEMIGGSSTDSYRFEYDYEPRAVLEELVATGVVPEQRSHQFYPTQEVLAREAVGRADIGDEHDCLEPSAGTGGLAQYMPKDRTLCIEISPVHCKVLSAKGFQVESADFLAWSQKTSKRFDRIVMNPPFAGGRAKLHLDAAAGLLRDAGRLVAILPGSMRGKDLLPGFACEWRGPYADQFEGTGVSVVMLVAQKN